METKARKTELAEINSLRSLFLQENNFQVRYNACHERGWSDSYLLATIDNIKIGYGSVKGLKDLKDRDTIFEFFVLPEWRNNSSELFSKLVLSSGAPFVECQSNDFLLSSMLFGSCHNISADTTLFKDHAVTQLTVPNAVFRPKRKSDSVFEHKTEPTGDYVLELHGEVVGTGGFMLHYNKPFADLYMEVNEEHRKKGFGSFIIQELKKECYRSGRVPAARCNIGNEASKATLLKAGLAIAGFMLTGSIKVQVNR